MAEKRELVDVLRAIWDLEVDQATEDELFEIHAAVEDLEFEMHANEAIALTRKVVNLGGGGGAGANVAGDNGGSGVVIVRWET